MKANDLKLAQQFIKALKDQNQDLAATVNELLHQIESYRETNHLLMEYLKTLQVEAGSAEVN